MHHRAILFGKRFFVCGRDTCCGYTRHKGEKGSSVSSPPANVMRNGIAPFCVVVVVACVHLSRNVCPRVGSGNEAGEEGEMSEKDSPRRDDNGGNGGNINGRALPSIPLNGAGGSGELLVSGFVSDSGQATPNVEAASGLVFLEGEDGAVPVFTVGRCCCCWCWY